MLGSLLTRTAGEEDVVILQCCNLVQLFLWRRERNGGIEGGFLLEIDIRRFALWSDDGGILQPEASSTQLLALIDHSRDVIHRCRLAKQYVHRYVHLKNIAQSLNYIPTKLAIR